MGPLLDLGVLKVPVSDGYYTDYFNLYIMYMPLIFLINQFTEAVTQLLASIASVFIYTKPKLEKQMVKFEILSAYMIASMMWQMRTQGSVGG